jgi:hypothetical protein
MSAACLPLGRLSDAKARLRSLSNECVIGGQRAAHSLVHHGEAIICKSLIIHQAAPGKPAVKDLVDDAPERLIGGYGARPERRALVVRSISTAYPQGRFSGCVSVHMDLLRNRSQPMLPKTKSEEKNATQWHGRGSSRCADEGQRHRSKIHDSRGTVVGLGSLSGRAVSKHSPPNGLSPPPR